MTSRRYRGNSSKGTEGNCEEVPRVLPTRFPRGASCRGMGTAHLPRDQSDTLPRGGKALDSGECRRYPQRVQGTRDTSRDHPYSTT